MAQSPPGRAAQSSGRRRTARPSQFLRYGLPFVSLIAVGSVGLSVLLQGRKDMEQVKDEEEWARIAATARLNRTSRISINTGGSSSGSTSEGTPAEAGGAAAMRKHIDLEEELKDVQKKIDINDFDYKPVPGPRNRYSQQ